MDPQEISEKDIFHEGHSIQTAKYSPITLETMMQNDHHCLAQVLQHQKLLYSTLIQ